MISAGVEGRLAYMTYPDHYRGPSKQPPEFLRPAPKPLPSARYNNGLHPPTQNGTRLGLAHQRTATKYSPPAVAAVNLTQHKEDVEDPYALYSRLFAHPQHHFFPQSPYSTLYQSPYPIGRPNFVHAPPLSPLEAYSPTTPTASTTFLSPPSTFSPPTTVKTTASRDKRVQLPPQPFKVPSGKEGSLKHRILTRPEDANPRAAAAAPLDLQRDPSARGKLTSASSPPRSPKRTVNNNTVPGNFAKGSLIQLANGELRRVEDMKTEDFVMSAEQCPKLRLADSTVVRIEENPITGTATITLSYNQRQARVEFESTLDHPYFVYGQGWASCNPDRTFHSHGLRAHQLQVGDVLVTLTPREFPQPPPPPPPPRGTTIITTATTTAVTARQVSTVGSTAPSTSSEESAESMASRKRRWSAPDQICDEDVATPRKH